MDEIPIRREKIKVENEEFLGKLGKKGASIKLKLIDEFGNRIGELTRLHSKQGKKLAYSLKYKGNRNISSTIELLDNTNNYKLPILPNEQILYGDINIPKNITDEIEGLGKIILDDALSFYKKNPKFGSADGNFGLWIKNMDLYENYGGQSVNLRKFWETMTKNGNNIKEAAFSTFTGKWAKENGFTNIYIKDTELHITKELVLIKFIKK